ncbi:MAG: ABC transporter ATP-binding protein [Pirellulaceae bacterium]
MMEENLAIETESLTRFFGAQCAVNQINLRVERGTFYGFLGPNGAGKSTTIKMLTGLLQPSGGEIRILGLNPRDAKSAMAIKRRIGVVPEDLALFENLTASEYLTFVGRMFLLDRQTIKQRAGELLAAMALDKEEKKLALEYSHGMQKKLALAAALLPNPDLLFLDEPFEGVDAVTSRVMRDILANFVARGSTVFLTSHVLEIVEKLCTHVGIISGGELVEQDSLAKLSQGHSLEQLFLQKVGSAADGASRLSWLEEETTP